MSEITARFEAAVETLLGDGPVKQRLIRAYTENLEDLTEARLPQEAGPGFGRLQSALDYVNPVGRETRVQASVQKMSAADAAGHARTILELYRIMVLAGRRADHLKVVETPAVAEPLPQFLVGGN